MVAKRKAVYEPIGEILDRETSLIQAGSILDVLMEIATETRNTELMTWCVSAWIDMADRLTNIEEDQEIINDGEHKHMLGFVPNGKEISVNESGN